MYYLETAALELPLQSDHLCKRMLAALFKQVQPCFSRRFMN
jgi:hypothetical protein